jgi:prephenate dehydratase
MAYQGAPGAFGHEAALRFAPAYEPVACATFAAALAMVAAGTADAAILPVANSIAGPVEEAVAALAASGLRVIEEHSLPVRLHLLGLPGSSLETVTIAVSHIMALRQCAWTLSRLDLGIEEAANTAIAARDLVESHKAALASAAAAEIHGLNILQEDLQDEPDNFTRFVLVSR